MSLFVDTSAFVALADRGDTHHQSAVQFIRNLPADEVMITSDYVMDETLTRLRFSIGHEAAMKFGTGILKSRMVRMIHIDESLWKQAWEFFKKYPDQAFSFTDCVSFAVMRVFDVSVAFSFDQDFLKAGLQIVP